MWPSNRLHFRLIVKSMTAARQSYTYKKATTLTGLRHLDLPEQAEPLRRLMRFSKPHALGTTGLT